jgi:hypothetical protein
VACSASYTLAHPARLDNVLPALRRIRTVERMGSSLDLLRVSHRLLKQMLYLTRRLVSQSATAVTSGIRAAAISRSQKHTYAPSCWSMSQRSVSRTKRVPSVHTHLNTFLSTEWQNGNGDSNFARWYDEARCDRKLNRLMEDVSQSSASCGSAVFPHPLPCPSPRIGRLFTLSERRSQSM